MECRRTGGRTRRHRARGIRGRREVRARSERRIGSRPGELHVPRAHVLAHVAPEQPITDERPLVRREVAAMLDREIGDAAARVHHVRRDEGVGRAGIEAAPAGAAAIPLKRQIGREGGIGENHADEREGADPGMDEHHVLGDPAQAGALRELPLRNGSRVHVAAGRRARCELTNRVREPVQAAGEHAMIVGGLSVLGDARLTPGRRPGVVEIVRQRDDRHRRFRHDGGRLFPFRRLAVQVRHRAGIAPGQPAVELGGVRVRLEGRHSHRIEAQFEGSTLQLDGLA